MARKELARVLNALLMEIEDGKQDFAAAAQECPVPRLKPLLVECSHDCARSLNGLEQTVQSLGEKAVRCGSAGGALYRRWSRLRLAWMTDHTRAALNSVARGGARIESAFDRALRADLPPPIRAVVRRERLRVLRNPRRVARLRRHALAGQTELG